MTCRWCMAEDEWKHTDGCSKVAIQERDALIDVLAASVRDLLRDGTIYAVADRMRRRDNLVLCAKCSLAWDTAHRMPIPTRMDTPPESNHGPLYREPTAEHDRISIRHPRRARPTDRERW